MKIRTLILLLVIGGCTAFIFLKIQSLGPENSSFNQTTRYTLGKYPIVRYILGLHLDGDARAEYLVGNSPIVVEIVQAPNAHLTEAVIKQFTDKVTKYTGRQTSVINVDIIKPGILNDVDLSEVVKNYRRHIFPGQPNLFVIYANDFAGGESEAARTYKEFGMVISDSKLSAVTGPYKEGLDQYIISTMLHEFGHQLGLDHININGCIMDADVESPGAQSNFTGIYTPVNFCLEELDKLLQIKKSLNK